MATALSPAEIEGRTSRPPEWPTAGGGGGFRPPEAPGRGWGGGSGGGGFPEGQRIKLGVWIGIAGIAMFFASLASAMIIRRAGIDWRSLELPQALWLSTALLLASSVTFELAKRQLRGGTVDRLRMWIAGTVVLGLGFLVAQWVGWMQLLRRGVAVGDEPAGAFFYLLTASHALHVAGGILALTWTAFRAWSSLPWPTRQPAVEATAVYWHFMDALWLVLLALLSFLG